VQDGIFVGAYFLRSVSLMRINKKFKFFFGLSPKVFKFDADNGIESQLKQISRVLVG